MFCSLNPENLAIMEATNALLIASDKGIVSDVLDALEKGAHINARNTVLNTSLWLAVLGSHIEIVKLLLERGAQVNIRNAYGESILFKAADIAMKTRNWDILRLLLIHGVDIA